MCRPGDYCEAVNQTRSADPSYADVFVGGIWKCFAELSNQLIALCQIAASMLAKNVNGCGSFVVTC